MTLPRGRLRLLAPLLAVVSALAAGLFTAAPASAAVVTPARVAASACAPSVAAEIVVLQPENRVKGISAAAPARIGGSASVSPDRVWVFALFLRFPASGVTVYVNGDPVNLMDPNGHGPCLGDTSASCVPAHYSPDDLTRAAAAAKSEPGPSAAVYGTMAQVCTNIDTIEHLFGGSDSCSLVDVTNGTVYESNYYQACLQYGHVGAGDDPRGGQACHIGYTFGYASAPVGGGSFTTFCVADCGAYYRDLKDTSDTQAYQELALWASGDPELSGLTASGEGSAAAAGLDASAADAYLSNIASIADLQQFVAENPTRILIPTPGGDLVPVPSDFVVKQAANSDGLIFQEDGAVGNANSVRIKWSDGTVRYYNKYGQPLDQYGRPGSQAATHLAASEMMDSQGYQDWLAQFG